MEYNETPVVGLIMGSKSDWETMQCASDVLDGFGVAHETRVVSAHRTPKLMCEYASSAASRGLKLIIAGAGGAAHLPGMVAANTALPVLGVPVKSRSLSGIDSLLSIVQMPYGVPVGTLSIGQKRERRTPPCRRSASSQWKTRICEDAYNDSSSNKRNESSRSP